MRSLLAVAAVLALTAGLSAAPLQTAKEAPPVAGKWKMDVDTPHGKMALVADLKVDGKQVTGTLSGEQLGTHPLKGEYADGKLTFAVSMQAGDMTFAGKVKDADNFMGNITGHSGDMLCVGTRMKDK
jgi:hypothetical protein